MDTEPLEAQLRNAEAKIREAEDNRRTALAEVVVKKAELTYSDKQYRRSKELVVRGAVSEQEMDIDLARMETKSGGIGGSAGTGRCAPNPRSMPPRRRPRGSRLKSRTVCSRPDQGKGSEPPGRAGRSLTSGRQGVALVDLSDVYMYVFLPEAVAGKVALGCGSPNRSRCRSRDIRSERSCRMFRPVRNSHQKRSKPPRSVTT